MNLLKRFTVVLVIFGLTAAQTFCWAADSGATLRTQGHVLVDGNEALPFAAIFHDARIETGKNSSAILELAGSRVEIAAETIVDFEADELRLEHGSLSVLTFQSLRVRAGCIIAVPVQPVETHFTMSDTDGRVTVAAVKSDVNMRMTSARPNLAAESKNSDKATVREGEQKSRDERCGAAQIETRAIAPGLGAILNSPIAVTAGAGAIGGVLCWVFCFHDGNPASPAKP